jgi:deoxyribodipyrimidine photo-lyase
MSDGAGPSNRSGPLTSRLPDPRPDDVVDWVGTHLADLVVGPIAASTRWQGTQAAADAALARLELQGYASRRNEVLPVAQRGATGLSPWIRHGFLTLPRVWSQATGPRADVDKFRDELLWQEYARHLYARLGPALREPLRYEAPSNMADGAPWDRTMACIAAPLEELERDGWLVNQTRMWLASQYTVRHGIDWRLGEAHFFAHLLDGSRAANRAGWQWTIGTATGRPYGFSRGQVERRAPELCRECAHEAACPIGDWPTEVESVPVEAPPRLRRDDDPDRTGGPTSVVRLGYPEAVWLTAESLGDDDPALAANPGLPVVFVFDEPLLQRLRLSAKRLVFIAERLAEIGVDRPLEVHRGKPGAVLHGRSLATTFTPVPGWRRLAQRPDGTSGPELVEVHPWPWLRRPVGGSVSSYSAWRRQLPGMRE